MDETRLTTTTIAMVAVKSTIKYEREMDEWQPFSGKFDVTWNYNAAEYVDLMAPTVKTWDFHNGKWDKDGASETLLIMHANYGENEKRIFSPSDPQYSKDPSSHSLLHLVVHPHLAHFHSHLLTHWNELVASRSLLPLMDLSLLLFWREEWCCLVETLSVSEAIRLLSPPLLLAFFTSS